MILIQNQPETAVQEGTSWCYGEGRWPSQQPPPPAPLTMTAGTPSLVLPAALQLDVQRGEGLGPDHVVHHACSVGVVRAIVELVDHTRGVFKALVPVGRGRNETEGLQDLVCEHMGV